MEEKLKRRERITNDAKKRTENYSEKRKKKVYEQKRGRERGYLVVYSTHEKYNYI